MNYIFDPVTNKKYNIFTTKGVNIIEKYIHFFQKGGSINDDIAEKLEDVLTTPSDNLMEEIKNFTDEYPDFEKNTSLGTWFSVHHNLNTDVINHFISLKGDVNVVHYNSSVLMEAIKKINIDSLEFLLDAKADPTKDVNGLTNLMVASDVSVLTDVEEELTDEQNDDISLNIKLLVKYKADVNKLSIPHEDSFIIKDYEESPEYEFKYTPLDVALTFFLENNNMNFNTSETIMESLVSVKADLTIPSISYNNLSPLEKILRNDNYVLYVFLTGINRDTGKYFEEYNRKLDSLGYDINQRVPDDVFEEISDRYFYEIDMLKLEIDDLNTELETEGPYYNKEQKDDIKTKIKQKVEELNVPMYLSIHRIYEDMYGWNTNEDDQDNINEFDRLQRQQQEQQERQRSVTNIQRFVRRYQNRRRNKPIKKGLEAVSVDKGSLVIPKEFCDMAKNIGEKNVQNKILIALIFINTDVIELDPLPELEWWIQKMEYYREEYCKKLTTKQYNDKINEQIKYSTEIVEMYVNTIHKLLKIKDKKQQKQYLETIKNNENKEMIHALLYRINLNSLNENFFIFGGIKEAQLAYVPGTIRSIWNEKDKITNKVEIINVYIKKDSNNKEIGKKIYTILLEPVEFRGSLGVIEISENNKETFYNYNELVNDKMIVSARHLQFENNFIGEDGDELGVILIPNFAESDYSVLPFLYNGNMTVSFTSNLLNDIHKDIIFVYLNDKNDSMPVNENFVGELENYYSESVE